MADLKSKSFVENVNTIANATTLATGDIIEDAQLAAAEAEASAAEALVSKQKAGISEELAHQWSNKAYNSPVINGEFSSYHWSVKAHENSGEYLIDDLVTVTTKTWSSQYISDELATKSPVGHAHPGVYEPVIAKNTAFNKNFVTGSDTGIADTVARGDHIHSGYENAIGDKGTAFNKNFGTNAGEVAEGDHSHAYMPLVNKNTAYNKNFPVDPFNPQADEVARGAHIHDATNISYDSTGDKVITSTTVNGALSQLDSEVGLFEVGEISNVSAGMTNPSQVVSITTAGTGEKLVTAMTVGGAVKNALYSGGDVVIDYPTDPSKLIEGWISASVTIAMEANTEYHMALWLNDVLIDQAFRAKLGSAFKDTVGNFSFNVDGFISGLSNGDKLAVGLYNSTDSKDITVTAHTISWQGTPQGALIASGITVTHNDVLAKDAINQHPFASIYETSTSNDLNVAMGLKADKTIPAVDGNVAALDATGNLIDSGISSGAIGGKMNLVQTPVLDNIVTMTSSGDSLNSSVKVSDLAKVNGDSTQVFTVATPVNIDHAVTKLMFDDALAQVATGQELADHTALPNPHNTTATDVGAALAVHNHVTGDITGLQTLLDSKYSIVDPAVQDNIVTFGLTGEIVDSGKNLNEIIGTPDATGFAGHTLSTRAAEAKDSEWSPFVTNPNVIVNDYVIQDGVSASVVSPILADGVTITIPDGSTLVIL